MSEEAFASIKVRGSRKSSVDLRDLKYKACIEIFNDLKADGYVAWVGRGKDGNCHIFAGFPEKELPFDCFPENVKFKRVVDVGVCDQEAYLALLDSALGPGSVTLGECLNPDVPEDSTEDDMLYAPFSFIPTRKLKKYYYSKGFRIRVRTKKGIKFLYAFKRTNDGNVIKRCLGLKSRAKSVRSHTC